jgi:hypothetical protein
MPGPATDGALRRSHVEQWVKTMQSAGLAPGTMEPTCQDALHGQLMSNSLPSGSVIATA